MGWFRRKKLTAELPEQVVRRAKMIPTAQLLDWAETSQYALQRHLFLYRSAPEAPAADGHLAEARQSAFALSAVLDEMAERSGTVSLPRTPAPLRDPQAYSQYLDSDGRL